MKIHVASVAMLALGLSVGCAADVPDADPQSTTQTNKEPSKDPKDSGAPDKTPSVNGIETIDAANAARLIAKNADLIILDIRTPAEFERGHLQGAVNINYSGEDYAEQLGKLDKEKTYLVH